MVLLPLFKCTSIERDWPVAISVLPSLLKSPGAMQLGEGLISLMMGAAKLPLPLFLLMNNLLEELGTFIQPSHSVSTASLSPSPSTSMASISLHPHAFILQVC